ncbi:MAG: O-antigen translocase [Dysgonomonas sp.]
MSKQAASYRQIVKSTGIFGGVQIANIIIGILRNKLIAVLLGAAGVGLISIYQSIIDLIRSISTLGIDTGGIRDIASTENNKEEQAKKIAVFKRWILITSCLGALICLVLCYPISLWAFGDSSYTLPVALLSISIFLTSLSLGQTVVMQGMRKIVYMAKSSLIGNFGGFLIVIPLYFFWGEKAIIPAFIIGSIILLVSTAFYEKKIRYPKVKVENRVALKEGISNLQLGLFIVTASILNTASMFFIRAFLSNNSSLEIVGIFQAAWTITTVYLSLVLKSMSNDYFPRLCAVSENSSRIRKLVNEQTYIATVIALPIIVIMMLYSNLILSVLYTSEFLKGTSLLQWQIAGSFFKILSWPMAFILLAKGKGAYHLFAEFLFFAIYIGFSYFLYPYFNLNAVGIAYFASYVIYVIIIYLYASKLCNFKWTYPNIRICAVAVFFIILSAATIIYLPDYKTVIGIFICLCATIYSLYMFNKVINISDILQRIKNKIFHR